MKSNNSSLKYKIKTATKKDIYLHLKECDGLFSPKLSETVNIQEYSNKIFIKSITFEAWIKKILIGLIAAYFIDIENHDAYITNVSVFQEYSGSGVASQLLQMCITHARQNYFSRIILEVNELNIPAVHLYEKYGFKIFEIKNSSFMMKLELPLKNE